MPAAAVPPALAPVPLLPPSQGTAGLHQAAESKLHLLHTATTALQRLHIHAHVTMSESPLGVWPSGVQTCYLSVLCELVKISRNIQLWAVMPCIPTSHRCGARPVQKSSGMKLLFKLCCTVVENYEAMYWLRLCWCVWHRLCSMCFGTSCRSRMPDMRSSLPLKSQHKHLANMLLGTCIFDLHSNILLTCAIAKDLHRDN